MRVDSEHQVSIGGYGNSDVTSYVRNEWESACIYNPENVYFAQFYWEALSS